MATAGSMLPNGQGGQILASLCGLLLFGQSVFLFDFWRGLVGPGEVQPGIGFSGYLFKCCTCPLCIDYLIVLLIHKKQNKQCCNPYGVYIHTYTNTNTHTLFHLVIQKLLYLVSVHQSKPLALSCLSTSRVTWRARHRRASLYNSSRKDALPLYLLLTVKREEWRKREGEESRYRQVTAWSG